MCNKCNVLDLHNDLKSEKKTQEFIQIQILK